jgi:hypothetical protein
MSFQDETFPEPPDEPAPNQTSPWGSWPWGTQPWAAPASEPAPQATKQEEQSK